MVTLSSELAARPNSAAPSDARQETEYRLFWRLRASGTWRREEFDSRDEAFDRYFYLLSKGLELRWRSV